MCETSIASFIYFSNLVGVANYVDSIPNVSEKVIDVHDNKVHKIVFYYGKSEFAFVDSDGWKSNLKFRINREAIKKFLDKTAEFKYKSKIENQNTQAYGISNKSKAVIIEKSLIKLVTSRLFPMITFLRLTVSYF